ncbi:MAG: hypothetical protein CEN88_58 [Candidatus Berkelbacteria bacterium Licking1014_2]|uniref:Uncharacterized protein n=1 Tax=Candidatus Berkelbacteria bacterium Licking1014_2 TaxID=2017146 RepID=A0A554LWW0_9BACT|nr:MAG: hypothetical protein CEN88_58 [Candidatus Berkelbacteria bacterium Licking1014_2]
MENIYEKRWAVFVFIDGQNNLRYLLGEPYSCRELSHLYSGKICVVVYVEEDYCTNLVDVAKDVEEVYRRSNNNLEDFLRTLHSTNHLGPKKNYDWYDATGVRRGMSFKTSN